MSGGHLWQGEYISDEELEKRLPKLTEELSLPPLDPRVCVEASGMLRDRIIADEQLKRELLAEIGVGEKAAAAGLQDLLDFLKPRELLKKLERELGSRDPGIPAASSHREGVYEFWSPLGLLVHIAPSNSFATGALSVVEGLLSGNSNFLKTSGHDGVFAQRFIKALCEGDQSGLLKQYIVVAKIPSSKEELLRVVLAQADGIAVWGGDRATESVRRMTPSKTKVIEWGHRISFVFVARESLREAEVLREVAKEICCGDQQACSSPQTVCVEAESRQELDSFAESLASELEKQFSVFGTPEPDLHESAEITKVTELCRMEECLGQGRVIEAADRSWRILIDYSPGIEASPLYRSVWVKPLKVDDAVATLRRFRPYLQTVGLACDDLRFASLSRSFATAGATRICRPGEMLGGYAGEPHDGVYALRMYSRIVSCRPGRIIAGGWGAEQTKKASGTATSGIAVELLSKESFSRTQPVSSELFFRSGGSSGAPAFSRFTYDDYRFQMACAADGLVAAGLDPRTDRCMNLFFGGGLYGGFLSFFTILEHLRVPQLPMAAHADLDYVVGSIITHNANVLLGMPSYLLMLFQQKASDFNRSCPVKKIFFGGEPLNEAQRRFFQGFGVEVIRSATYGSNDLGPLGYQCEHCEGGIHHLHSRLHEMSIMKMDQDYPVDTGECGRLVFETRAREGYGRFRYDIGDMGRYVAGKCDCGRNDPRFELLGRHGDVFKAGGSLLNYRKFVEILESLPGFSGEFQLELRRDGEDGGSRGVIGKEKLVLKYCSEDGISADDIRNLCLSGYHELREVCELDRLVDFDVLAVASADFVRTLGSGKLRTIVDLR